jgi:hypothetical protein
MLPTLLHDPRRNVPQQGIHTMGYTQLFNPGLTDLPQPQRGGLQSSNMTVTPTGTTLPCKAWSFIEGFKPRHHAHE